MEEKVEAKSNTQDEIKENERPHRKENGGDQSKRKDEDVGFSIGADAGW